MLPGVELRQRCQVITEYFPECSGLQRFRDRLGNCSNGRPDLGRPIGRLTCPTDVPDSQKRLNVIKELGIV